MPPDGSQWMQGPPPGYPGGPMTPRGMAQFGQRGPWGWRGPPPGVGPPMGGAPLRNLIPSTDAENKTKPTVMYYDLPAGLMAPMVGLADNEYKPLDPNDIRLPPPMPPSERLLAAVEAFYAPPTHENPRDRYTHNHGVFSSRN